jgi:hypothetical protein
LCIAPNLYWIVLDPSRSWKNLLVFELRLGHDASRLVEDDEARAAGALVNGS